MIRIAKDYESVPEKLRSDACQNLIRQALNERNTHVFKGEYYNKGCIKELEEIYHCKCAYCETDSSAGAPFEIDHFRPKKKRPNSKEAHKGYYWLGYEWSNLLLSCSWCNKKKGDKFPIEDETKRVHHPIISDDGLPEESWCSVTSQHLLQEKPQLLNPEIDQVEDHFIFRPDGTVVHLTEQGRLTIQILQLNRERLVFRRKKVVGDYFQDIKSVLADYLTEKIDANNLRANLNRLFEKLLTYQQPTQEYSRLRYFMFKKFIPFASGCLETEERHFVTMAFQSFVENRGIRSG